MPIVIFKAEITLSEFDLLDALHVDQLKDDMQREWDRIKQELYDRLGIE